MSLDLKLQQELDDLATKLKQVSEAMQLNPETGKCEYNPILENLCNQRK